MSEVETGGRQWRTYAVAAGVTAFAANWVWEMAHMRTGRELEIQPWLQTIPMCTVAASGDVILTVVPYVCGALIAWNARLAWTGRVKTYLSLAALGFATAATGEYIGLAADEWTYNERMPIVPELGIGAWPALQLTLLVPRSLVVANFARRRVR